MKKRFAIIALALALTAGSAMTSFAAGFTGTGKGVKYQWGDGSYCTNNWVQYRNHWFYAADTGELQGGIMKINGNVYYFDTSSCKMVTGNYNYNGGNHEFTENGTTDGGPYVYNEWNSNGTIKRGAKFGVR